MNDYTNEDAQREWQECRDEMVVIELQQKQQREKVLRFVKKRVSSSWYKSVLAFVDEYGDVKKAQVIKGIGGGCDEEALKAVKETKFTPGICNGEPCKVRISLPIVFSLE